MMLIIHFWELPLLFVIQTECSLTISKRQMNWFDSFNYCKLSTLGNVQEINGSNVWLGGLLLQTPWMFHRGCFERTTNGPWNASAYYDIEWNITSLCSYKCKNNGLFALKANRCACLKSLTNMVKTETDYCTLTCNGSEKDPCGAARYFTVYEQEVENGIPHNRQPKFKWITNETFAEIRNETANFYNVKCLLLNESLQSVPMFCNLNYSALCESGSEREISSTTTPGKRQSVLGTTANVKDQRTKTTDIIHVKTRSSSNEMSVISEAFTTTTSSWTKSLIPIKITTISDINDMKTQQHMTVISYVSTTAPPGTNPLVLANTIEVTVIIIVGSSMVVGIAVVVIMILYKRKRKRMIYYSRNSAFSTLSRSVEGEHTMQMLSSNNQYNNRTNAVPYPLQQKQHPRNISVSNYQDPVDMDKQYQRIDFTMRNDLKEVHNDYGIQLYNRTSNSAVNDGGSKPLKKAGLTKGTKDLKEVYNNYSLPYDTLSRPSAVNKEDMKIQIKVRPSVTTKDEKLNNVAYCDTAIVHEDFLYDIPKHSNKSLDN